jgi:hypothetical protein
MDLNGEHLILLPVVDSKSNYLEGFWRWVEILANDDYERALESLYWSRGTTRTPETLKETITTFFGGDAPWSVVVPNERLVGVVDAAAKFDPPHGGDQSGWFMAQIPLTTEPADPKNDKIPLMGLASSFFVRPHRGYYVLEHEIFHL